MILIVAFVVLAAGVGWWRVHVDGQGGLGVDDAYIFLRYGRNLSSGYGWVWNPGAERVEGTTSVLWTIIVAAAFALSSDPRWLLFGVSIVLTAATLTGVSIAVARTTGCKPWTIAAWLAGTCIALPSFLIWSAAPLMDAPLWGAVVTWAAIKAGAPRSRWAIAPVFALLAVARPEGVAVGLVLGLLHLCWYRRWTPIVTVAGVAGAVTICRLVYFGHPVPNTFYAKVGTPSLEQLVDGARYVGSFALAYPVAILALAVGVWAGSARPSRFVLGAGAAILTIIACTIVVGGDYDAEWRFLAPLLPLGFAVTACGWPRSMGGRRLPWLPAATALLALLLTWALGQTTVARPSGIAGGFAVARTGLATGHVLNRLFPMEPRPVVGVATAGGLPFIYQGPSFDTLGLNDVEVAHASRDRRELKNHAAFSPMVFRSRLPDIAAPELCTADQPSGSLGLAWPLVVRVTRGMVESAWFRESYTRAFLAPSRDARDGICAFVRTEMLARWAESGRVYAILVSLPARTGGGWAK